MVNEFPMQASVVVARIRWAGQRAARPHGGSPSDTILTREGLALAADDGRAGSAPMNVKRGWCTGTNRSVTQSEGMAAGRTPSLFRDASRRQSV